jgi:hypothetical protein
MGVKGDIVGRAQGLAIAFRRCVTQIFSAGIEPPYGGLPRCADQVSAVGQNLMAVEAGFLIANPIDQLPGRRQLVESFPMRVVKIALAVENRTFGKRLTPRDLDRLLRCKQKRD